ncbi:MAG: hypothetical protein M3P89_12845 [Actinomycetota bacterium]|nr:hypothetical protein [Actinomycetota bacterium]
MSELIVLVLVTTLLTTVTWELARVIRGDGYGRRQPPARYLTSSRDPDRWRGHRAA